MCLMSLTIRNPARKRRGEPLVVMNDPEKRTKSGPRDVQTSNRWAAAVQHLRRVDPHLRAIIDRIGPCRLEPHADRFSALVRSIISQQISTKAAASINRAARGDGR